jgi:hypothetical protein
VRVAFSGSHRVGKTTLIEEVAKQLPAYTVIDEPYRVLEEAGYEASDPPSVEDFEHQLRTSIELVGESPANALFDRCPLDLVAYLEAIGGDVDIDEIRDAMTALDLIVVVPIEIPDRITVAAHEDAGLRRRVDERLQHLVLEDPYGFEIATLEVRGNIATRGAQVAEALRRNR